MARLDPIQVKHQLDILGLTQQQFAARAGISDQTLSHGMRGRSISRASVLAIAKALLELQPAPGIGLVLAQPAGQP